MRTGRARARSAMVLALVLLSVAACQPRWGQTRFAPSGTGANPDAAAFSPAAVADLQPSWSTPLGPLGSGPLIPTPVVGDGMVVVSTHAGVQAFPADGSGCVVGAGCTPAWTGTTPGAPRMSPALWGSTVIVPYGFPAVGEVGIAGFDLRGVEGCVGAPVVCEPLWVIPGVGSFAPAVVGSTLYVHGTVGVMGTLFAYDLETCGAGGCALRWIGTGVGGTALRGYAPPTVADGKVYVSGTPGVSVFDAAGIEGCTPGPPTTCEPLWEADLERGRWAAEVVTGPVAVAGGHLVAVSHDDGANREWLDVVDADGVEGCGGEPVACPSLGAAHAPDQAYSGPALVGGIAYTAGVGAGGVVELRAVDVGACVATPAPCPPATVWQASGGIEHVVLPTVGGDVVFLPTTDGPVAFDRTPAGCGTEVAPCPPVWSSATPGARWSEVVVVGRLVLAIGGPALPGMATDGVLHVWQLPA